MRKGVFYAKPLKRAIRVCVKMLCSGPWLSPDRGQGRRPELKGAELWRR